MILYDEVSKMLREVSSINKGSYLHPAISPIVENIIKDQIKDDVRVVGEFTEAHAGKLLHIVAQNDADFFLKFVKFCEDCKSTNTKRRFVKLYEIHSTRKIVRLARERGLIR